MVTKTQKQKQLSAKQVKALQNIVSIACWAEVVEQTQTNEKGLQSILEKLYIGDSNDDDSISKKDSFFNGTGRFEFMYDDQNRDKISMCYGSIIGGLNKHQFCSILDVATLTKLDKLNGRSIKAKIDQTVKEGKKYLGY
jgi:hypothetical protein